MGCLLGPILANGFMMKLRNTCSQIASTCQEMEAVSRWQLLKMNLLIMT